MKKKIIRKFLFLFFITYTTLFVNDFAKLHKARVKFAISWEKRETIYSNNAKLINFRKLNKLCKITRKCRKICKITWNAENFANLGKYEANFKKIHITKDNFVILYENWANFAKTTELQKSL